jgi:hypothetical protein
MILYLKDPKDSTKKPLKVINTLSKEAAKITNISDTNNERSEKETRKPIPFTIASKNFKWLGINLLVEVKELYNENSKPLKKEVSEDSSTWKDSRTHGLAESTL